MSLMCPYLANAFRTVPGIFNGKLTQLQNKAIRFIFTLTVLWVIARLVGLRPMAAEHKIICDSNLHFATEKTIISSLRQVCTLNQYVTPRMRAKGNYSLIR